MKASVLGLELTQSHVHLSLLVKESHQASPRGGEIASILDGRSIYGKEELMVAILGCCLAHVGLLFVFKLIEYI